MKFLIVAVVLTFAVIAGGVRSNPVNVEIAAAPQDAQTADKSPADVQLAVRKARAIIDELDSELGQGATAEKLQESVRKARQIIEDINIDIIQGGGGGYGGYNQGYGGYNQGYNQYPHHHHHNGGGFNNGFGGGYGGGYEDININIDTFGK